MSREQKGQKELTKNVHQILAEVEQSTPAVTEEPPQQYHLSQQALREKKPCVHTMDEHIQRLKKAGLIFEDESGQIRTKSRNKKNRGKKKRPLQQRRKQKEKETMSDLSQSVDASSVEAVNNPQPQPAPPAPHPGDNGGVAQSNVQPSQTYTRVKHYGGAVLNKTTEVLWGGLTIAVGLGIAKAAVAGWGWAFSGSKNTIDEVVSGD